MLVSPTLLKIRELNDSRYLDAILGNVHPEMWAYRPLQFKNDANHSNAVNGFVPHLPFRRQIWNHRGDQRDGHRRNDGVRGKAPASGIDADRLIIFDRPLAARARRDAPARRAARSRPALHRPEFSNLLRCSQALPALCFFAIFQPFGCGSISMRRRYCPHIRNTCIAADGRQNRL